MYYRLRNEIDKRGYTIEKFAVLANMSEKSLRNKLNGATDFSWSEVLLIRKLLDSDLSLEELFKREDKIAWKNTCSNTYNIPLVNSRVNGQEGEVRKVGCLEPEEMKKKKEVVGKILQLFVEEGLSVNQANDIPELLKRRLLENGWDFGREQKFTIYQ